MSKLTIICIAVAAVLLFNSVCVSGSGDKKGSDIIIWGKNIIKSHGGKKGGGSIILLHHGGGGQKHMHHHDSQHKHSHGHMSQQSHQIQYVFVPMHMGAGMNFGGYW